MTSFERKVDEFYGEGAFARTREPLPPYFRPHRAEPAFVHRDGSGSAKFDAPYEGNGPLGVRWHYGPLRFERFEDDEEPRPDPKAPLRLVIWQRVLREERERGWWPGDRQMGVRMGGLTFLESDDYASRWRTNARRQLKRWEKRLVDGERELVTLTLDEFIAGYKKAEQVQFMKIFYLPVVKAKTQAHGELVRFIGSRRPGGPVDAGLATIDVPECGTSIHLAAFIGGAAKDDGVGTGLIDVWFRECRARAIKVIDWGYLWYPGDLDEYKGFSRFKAQFDMRLMPSPRPLVRLMGRLWRR